MPSQPISPVVWTNPTRIVQLPPETLKQILDQTKNWVDRVDGVLNILIDILETSSGFIGTPTDIAINFIRTYAQSGITILRDLLSFGGGAIVITPFNRLVPRKLPIVPHPYPLSIPTLTPREAFNDFYASFNNTQDPNRPQWTDNTKVAGVGFLIMVDNPADLSKIASGMSMLFSFKEFTDIASRYTNTIGTWANNITQEGLDYLSIFTDKGSIKFDVTGFPNGSFVQSPDLFQSGINLTNALVAQDSNFTGKLHWYGLSLNNFVWLKKTVDVIEELYKKLISLLETSENAIQQLIKAIIRKIEDLKNLINIVYDTVAGILVGLSTNGLYVFTVPEGTGGLTYLKSAIETSISNPQTEASQRVRAGMDTSSFSSLFFIGTSTGFNTDAWKAMFENSWNPTPEQIQTLENLTNPQFTVTPEVDGKVFNFGDLITISVNSQDDSPSNPLFFTYQFRDNNNIIISEWTNDGTNNERWARVNKSKFPQILDYSSSMIRTEPINATYNLSVQITNSTGVEIGTFRKNLIVSNSLSYNGDPTTDLPVTPYSALFLTGISTIVDDTHPVIYIYTSTPGGALYSSGVTASIRNPNGPSGGIAQETVFISSNSLGAIGYSIEAGSIPLVLRIEDTVGNVIILPIINNKGRGVSSVTKFPLDPSYKFLTYPASMLLDFGPEYTAIKICNSLGVCYYVNLPGFISLDKNVTYTYWVQKNGEWIGPFTFQTVTRVLEGTVICG